MSDLSRSLALLAVTPGWRQLVAARDLDSETVTAILSEAARVAADTLAPLGRAGDAVGCRLVDGRVATPPGYAQAYAQMGRDGWLAMDLPAESGGQDLPIALHAAASTFFEGAAMAFMMANGSSRAAAHLLGRAAPALAADWVPRLAAGEWCATICISEPEAGSDLGRIRTRAATDAQGNWHVTGTKCWISFGDHDMAARIGHLLLARTGGTGEGTRGLGLFLVPDRRDDGSPNAISVTRIEQKMGLHGAPTCELAFDGAEARLIGEPGAGLRTLFTMIALMRLQTACQGLGVAQRATAIARGYAAERRQGGHSDAPPVPIAAHADVRRQITAMAARTEVLRAVVFDLAMRLEEAQAGDSAAEQLAAFMLPLAKNFGAETGFDVASAAVQVLGGAGYTRDWPVEQLMRDARVIAIYEGTTGMQARDVLHRGLLRARGRGFEAFDARAAADIAACPDADAAAHARALQARFADLSRGFLDGAPGLAPPDLAADGYLRAGWAALSAAACCRMIASGHARLARLARFRLHQLDAEMRQAEAGCRLDESLLDPAPPAV